MNIKFSAEQNHFFIIIFNVFLGSVFNLRQLVAIAGINVPISYRNKEYFNCSNGLTKLKCLQLLPGWMS